MKHVFALASSALVLTGCLSYKAGGVGSAIDTCSIAYDATGSAYRSCTVSTPALSQFAVVESCGVTGIEK